MNAKIAKFGELLLSLSVYVSNSGTSTILYILPSLTKKNEFPSESNCISTPASS